MAWHAAASVDEVGDDEVIGVVIEGQPIAIYRLGGQLYATHNICSHEHALLSDGYIEGDCIECPLHQARFHIPTGEVRSAPATEPVKTYSIKVQGDQILVDVPDA
ncbi:MAG TPA: non-heme iron oxygenase ferredoxin subunit [Alphaproteobacteria bacterium]|nr:non-heme iron oxygenase ferredoxin subunit [Alphaproteobacteria bacterium]